LDRPHTRQRLLCLTANFGCPRNFAIDDFLAIFHPYAASRKGIPNFFSKAKASPSVLAEVTNVMFIPLVCSTLV
jgi:hypothetical protein